ncbi:MAG TPA: cadmium-translocating P-type ATPase [Lachnospiraceae bacterium]|uniref:heavy metal translocating P-type ATPase n=1 Tax=Anaerosporobacter sp. TaxID=1872529 RepID=UPI000EDA6620|nr:heavy metal translocating P-type ATPase [Anaerosporobacter sp.]HAB61517.1 cadmium-translocating P-type ATPase [Lachnospiraceae bacterium]
MKSKKFSFNLENLGCANCAAKMEKKLKSLDGIDEVQINFVNKKLFLTFKESKQLEDIHPTIQNICSNIESEVIVSPILSNATSNTTTNSLTHNHDTEESCGCGEHHHDEHDSCGCDKHHHDEHNEHEGHNHDKNSSSHSHNHQHGGEHSKGELLKKVLTLLIGTVIGFIPIVFDIPNPLGIIILIAGYLILSYKILIESAKNISHGQIFDENFLMVIATLGAFYTKQYPEALVVMLLFQIGELLQDIAVDNSRKQLKSVMNLKPDYANLQTNSGVVTVAPEAVNIGDVIVVKPSERIPLDGEVIEGTSFVDTSSLTGESVPRSANIGDTVLSGSINGSGTLFVKVNSTYSNSTVAKVLDLVENASNRKSSTENFITKFAAIYTPIVVLLAILLAIFPPILTGTNDFSLWIYRACGFLVVSCPCALVISIPLGFFGGIGNASKHGILVKGSNYLEALNFVETAVFDKTGTLTQGVFEVTNVNVANEASLLDILSDDEKSTLQSASDQLLHVAGLVESYSNHPIAKSITKAANIPSASDQVSNYEEIAGHGIRATLSGQSVLAGSAKLLKKFNINFSEAPADTLGSIVYIALNDTFSGYLVISDQIKKDSKQGLEELRKLGIQTVMLTGDMKASAEIVGKELNLDTIYSELLPGDKVDKIEELLHKKGKNKNVIFTGDGMNDAPVLARADIGIAMGGVGSDAAIEAADIVIMTDEPSKIAQAIKIAKHTRKIVTENIILSLGIKFIVLFLVAFGMGSMWLAIFADVGVALIAIFNSIRALRYNL